MVRLPFVFRSGLRHLAALFCLAAPLAAQDGPGALVEMRVVPGWTDSGGTRYAALHLRLAPGWKTYWRLPGAGGIAPDFDWARSANATGIGVHWPHPEIFEDFGLRTVGYADEVYLPLTVTGQDDSAPVEIAARAALGVCRDICVPVTLEASARLNPSDRAQGADARGVRAALASARHARRGAGAATCAVAPIDDGVRLDVTFEDLPEIGGTDMVFISPDRPDIWVSEPAVEMAGGRVRASAELVPPEGQPFALDRSSLRFTLLGPSGSADLTGCDAG